MGRRRRSSGGALVYLFLFAILFYVVLAIAAYALVVAIVAVTWAAVEAWRRHQGRPFVEPKQRFLAVWTRGVSPVDPKHWVTPVQRPATDPHLLPGQVTGSLRVESRGIRRADEPGPFEWFMISASITNHGTQPVTLGSIDDVDVQLWDINSKVVGTDTTWSRQHLAPGQTCDVVISVRVVDDVPIASWAISHLGAQAPYVFFTATAGPVERETA